MCCHCFAKFRRAVLGEGSDVDDRNLFWGGGVLNEFANQRPEILGIEHVPLCLPGSIPMGELLHREGEGEKLQIMSEARLKDVEATQYRRRYEYESRLNENPGAPERGASRYQ